MATAKSTTTARKRVEATVLKRARDGSAFTRCEGCNKNVPVVLIDLHSCSLDSKIRTSLEAQVVEKTVEISKPEKKRKAPSSAAAGKGAKKGKSGGGAKNNGKKRPPTAFFIFMNDFRLEFKASNPDEKGIAAVGKAAGIKWKAMTDEEKKPYLDQAKELKAKFDSGEEASEENDAAEEEENAEAAEEEEEEVEQPEEMVGDAPAAEEELEKNELDDDI